MTYSAAVVGLGNIGMLYDYKSSLNTQILTHCAAYHAHPGFTLSAGVDPDPHKRELFERKYQQPAYASLSELLSAKQVDVLSFCLPCEYQGPAFFECVKVYHPKAIIFEKPISADYHTAEQISDYVDAQQLLGVVNYFRRFEPGVNDMIAQIKQGIIGDLHNIIAWYSKSLLTNGCHIIDLLHYAFTRVYGHCEISDIQAGDLSAIRLRCNGVPVTLFLTPPEYVRFEIQFEGKKGIIRYAKSGRDIQIKQIAVDPVFGSTVLADKDNMINSDLDRYQWHTQNLVFQALTVGTELPSTCRTALPTQKLIGALNGN